MSTDFVPFLWEAFLRLVWYMCCCDYLISNCPPHWTISSMWEIRTGFAHWYSLNAWCMGTTNYFFLCTGDQAQEHSISELQPQTFLFFNFDIDSLSCPGWHQNCDPSDFASWVAEITVISHLAQSQYYLMVEQTNQQVNILDMWHCSHVYYKNYYTKNGSSTMFLFLSPLPCALLKSKGDTFLTLHS